MKLVVEKKTGLVVMRSEGDVSVDTSKFDVVDYTPTAEETTKFEENAIVKRDGKSFTFTDNPHKARDLRINAIKAFKEKQEKGTATDADKLEMITHLLDK